MISPSIPAGNKSLLIRSTTRTRGGGMNGEFVRRSEREKVPSSLIFNKNSLYSLDNIVMIGSLVRLHYSSYSPEDRTKL
jgi:hypothetical protein